VGRNRQTARSGSAGRAGLGRRVALRTRAGPQAGWRAWTGRPGPIRMLAVHGEPGPGPALPFLAADWGQGMAPSPAHRTATGVTAADRESSGRTVPERSPRSVRQGRVQPKRIPVSARPGQSLAPVAARSPRTRCMRIRHNQDREPEIPDRRRLPDRNSVARGRLAPSWAAAGGTARCRRDGPRRMGSRPRSGIHRENPLVRCLVRRERRGVSRVFFSLSSGEDLHLQLAILLRGPY
jgi:hypothetical protein